MTMKAKEAATGKRNASVQASAAAMQRTERTRWSDEEQAALMEAIFNTALAHAWAYSELPSLKKRPAKMVAQKIRGMKSKIIKDVAGNAQDIKRAPAKKSSPPRADSSLNAKDGKSMVKLESVKDEEN